MKGEANLRLEIKCEGSSDFMVQRDSPLEQCWLISIVKDELYANRKTDFMPMKRYGLGEFQQRDKQRSILGRGDLEGGSFVGNPLYLLSFRVNP